MNVKQNVRKAVESPLQRALKRELRIAMKRSFTYQLRQIDKTDFARRVLIERAKSSLESILDYLAPQRILVVGFDGGQANDIVNEADLGRLKELGYQVVLKVTPQPNAYLITEVV